jgi:hypothetical protein
MSTEPASNYDPAGRSAGKSAAEESRESWDSDTLAREADRTRYELNQTLEALEAKLSPRQMLHRAVARGRGVVGAAGETAREHPLLVGICGVALFSLLGYLLMRQSEPPRESRWADVATRYRWRR